MIEDVAPQEITSWRSRLDEVFSTMAGLFGRVELRRRARTYLIGLLSPLERKTGWQLAAAAGDPTPVRVQHFLSRAVWSADLVRDALRAYAAAHLAGPGGALVVDETGFPKRGPSSAGVQRQFLHATGRTENCQVGVFLAYVGERGAALIDRELYLPPSWAEDPDRCAAAGVPAGRVADGALAKPRLAEAMIGRAVAAGVEAGWVAADATYGRDSAFLAFLSSRRLSYVVEVPLTQTLRESDESGRVDVLASGAPESAWHRVPPRPGGCAAGEYDWAWATLPGADDLPPGFVRTLLVRRSTERPAELVYYLCFHADAVRREEIVRTAEARRIMAACLRAAKAECGLDHYQVRRWEGWYRHVTLAMLAHAFVAVTTAAERAQGEVGGPEAPRAIHWR
ncbi:IS701 family transposase [Glycomyces endophyticus]